MTKKVKNILAIVIVVSIVLGSNWLYFYPRLYRQAQNYPYGGDELTEAFLEQFPGNYNEILRKEQDGLTVFLGYYSEMGQGYYACYEKAPFFDRWMLVEQGSLGMGRPSKVIRANDDYRLGNRVYVSLNSEHISKIVVTMKGGEREVVTDPDRIFAVVTRDEIEAITFFTDKGERISEEEFLIPSKRQKEEL